MTPIQCPVCSTEAEFKIKRQPTDIPGVLKEYIQCPKCPYTWGIKLTNREIITLEKQITIVNVMIASHKSNEIEPSSVIETAKKTLQDELGVAKRELANKLNEQS